MNSEDPDAQDQGEPPPGEGEAGLPAEALQDRYLYGSPLTAVGAFQMLAEEALRDGDIDARDNAILRVFVRGFGIEPDDARVIADVAREKQRLGHLHVRRPFDRLKLYKRLLRYSMAHTGEDEEELSLLERYRRIFKIDETGEAEIRRSARADLRMTENTMIPAQILQLRESLKKEKEGAAPVTLRLAPPSLDLDQTLNELDQPDFRRPEPPAAPPPSPAPPAPEPPGPPAPPDPDAGPEREPEPWREPESGNDLPPPTRLFPEGPTLSDFPLNDSTLAETPGFDATISDRTISEAVPDVTPITDETLADGVVPPSRIAAPVMPVKPVPLKPVPLKPPSPEKKAPEKKTTDKGAAVQPGGRFSNLPGRDQALSLAAGFGILIMINLLRVFIQGRTMPAWPFACFALSLIYATIAMASETEDGKKK